MQGSCLVISGPTGAGKSELAIKLALDAEIINIDSVQLYSGHQIGAAAPKPELLNALPHHLYGFLEGDQQCDVALYLKHLNTALQKIVQQGALPVIVGGTTLYLSSWINGLESLPKKNVELRNKLEQFDNNELYKNLSDTNPARAKELHPNDRVRVVRALEISEAKRSNKQESQYSYLCCPYSGALMILCLVWPRDLLYARIDQRSSEMVKSGLVEEARRLYRKYGDNWVSKGALGYKEALEEICSNEINQQRLIDNISMHTRRYAKRQMTFWRNAPKKFGWVIHPDNSEGGILIGAEGAKKSSETREGIRCFQMDINQLKQKINDFLGAKNKPGVQVLFLEARSLWGS